MLKNKNAVFYGAGGSVAGAVAKVFANAGATVFLTGPRLDKIESLAAEIVRAGGKAEVAIVDALNEDAVNTHMDGLLKQFGHVDVSFNLIGVQDVQNILLVDMPREDFARPLRIAMESQFTTMTAAGRAMMKQQSGVILSLTATPGGVGYPKVGGFGPVCNAIEGLSRSMAVELGPYGVRVVNIRSAGSPDSRPFVEALQHGGAETREFMEKLREDTMLKTLPLMADIANTALFLASPMAGKITGITLDVTCGTTSGLNYKTPIIPFG
ncbi:SDR family NAD(P)-dependent oxidoreductase [Chryseolinea lacunae]|uniref:SDR family oxidoreductase n=1 Tax=Chryseolinea lacunae TaxID=2801331 RepID=A0ABS1KMG4_9BACT|nr:SDR family oxidoreductase [Chryseolinea lacunae]MBL0740413.1 SDR family oxidoreductase [Chryseolinea lacunae]